MFCPLQITGRISVSKYARGLLIALLMMVGATNQTHAEIGPSAQQEWLRAHGDIVVGTTAQGRDFYETWRQGQLHGLSVDYLDMLTKILGVNYRIKPYPTWHDLYLAVCTGQVDLVMTQAMSETTAQQSCMSYTRPYFKAMPIVVSRRGSGVLDTADLHGLNLAVEDRSPLVEALSTRYKNISIKAYDNVATALEQVRDGTADAFVGSPRTVRALMEDPAFRQLHIIGSINTAGRNLTFGLGPGREPLRDALDAALRSLSPEQQEAVSHAWSTAIEPTARIKVALSPEEARWLSTLPTLRVGFPMREFPYGFFNHYGQPSGIAADFLEIVAQGLGLHFDFVPTESYEGAQALLRSGAIDLIAVSQDHSQEFPALNTQAYAEAPLVIVTGYSDSVSDLRDLHGAAVYLDASAPPALLTKLQHFGVSTTSESRIEKGLDHVRDGEARAYIGDLFLLDPLIQSNYVGEVRIAAPVGARKGISIGISTRLEPLVPLVNRILSNLPSGREQRVASTWLAPKYTYGIPESVFWTEILPAMAIILAIGSGFAAGYWRLRKEIRRRIEVEAQLETARDLAQSQAQARSTFLAVMSHEIRTPLSGVIGMLELLGRTGMRSEQREMVAVIDESAHSLLKILDTVLDYTKVDADQMELERIPVNLRSLVANVMLLMGEPARRRGVLVSHHVDERIAPAVLGDPVRLRQVLVNLVGNAAKFTHKGEIRVGVNLLSDTKGRQRLEFIVSDSGTGVAPEALKNLTQPFKQADRSTARKYGGTGLGLAVSQKLVKLMGGTLTLKSELGKGTQARFQCDFSASSASPQGPEATIERPILAAPQPEALTGRREHRAPDEPISRPRILIAEDHHINRQMLARQLDAVGCQSVAVVDGAAALEALGQERYDLLLTDWQLPVQDGGELAKTWRARERALGASRRLPIVILSAALQPDQEAWRRAGINAYLRKPVRLDVLRETLARFIPQWIPPPLRANSRTAEVERHRGIDMQSLCTTFGTLQAASQMLADSSALLRSELETLRQELSTIVSHHWAPSLHRILGALSTLGEWDCLGEGERIERAIANGKLDEWTPAIFELLNDVEIAIDEAAHAAKQH